MRTSLQFLFRQAVGFLGRVAHVALWWSATGTAIIRTEAVLRFAGAFVARLNVCRHVAADEAVVRTAHSRPSARSRVFDDSTVQVSDEMSAANVVVVRTQLKQLLIDTASLTAGITDVALRLATRTRQRRRFCCYADQRTRCAWHSGF